MSAFLPSIEVTLSDNVHDCSQQLNRGQWVKCGTAKGRIINTETMSILWRHAGESFKGFTLRFKRATTPKIRRARSFLRSRQLDLFTDLVRTSKKHFSNLLSDIKALRLRLSIHREVLSDLDCDTDAFNSVSSLVEKTKKRFLALCAQYENQGTQYV